MSRKTIQLFALANPLYRNATVTFCSAVNGVKTSTIVVLYSSLTGSGTLVNPHKLDSHGKFKQPVYIDAPVVGTIQGISVPSHDTGILFDDISIPEGSITGVDIGGGEITSRNLAPVDGIMWIPISMMYPLTYPTEGPNTWNVARNLSGGAEATIPQFIDAQMSVGDGLGFDLVLPRGWDRGTLNYRVHWVINTSVPITGNNANFSLEGTGGRDASSLDSDFGTAVTIEEVVETPVAFTRYITQGSDILTVSGTLGYPDIMEFRLKRVAASANEISADISIRGIELKYNVGLLQEKLPAPRDPGDTTMPDVIEPELPTAAMVLWLDASDESTFTLSDIGATGGGRLVNQWRDKSGNDNHASVPGATLGAGGIPTGVRNPSRIGNAVSFSEFSAQSVTNKAIVCSERFIDSGDPFSYYIVCCMGIPIMFGDGDQNHAAKNTASNLATILLADGSNYAYLQYDASWYVGDITASVAFSNSYRLDPKVKSVRSNGSTYVERWTNKVNHGQTGYSGTTAAKAIGGSETYQGQGFFTVMELIVFDQALSDADNVLVQNYLINKWGL